LKVTHFFRWKDYTKIRKSTFASLFFPAQTISLLCLMGMNFTEAIGCCCQCVFDITNTSHPKHMGDLSLSPFVKFPFQSDSSVSLLPTHTSLSYFSLPYPPPPPPRFSFPPPFLSEETPSPEENGMVRIQ
jgi:hypothetical protein